MNLLSYLFGCSHDRRTFPQSTKKRSRPEAAIVTGHWVTCLDCGKELPYDWDKMQVLKTVRQQRSYMRLIGSVFPGQ